MTVIDAYAVRISESYWLYPKDYNTFIEKLPTMNLNEFADKFTVGECSGHCNKIKQYKKK